MAGELANIFRQSWDAVIIGAGPAGSVSAIQLARAGWRVLLVERAAWPRDKVCGGCVNADAIALLRSVGIELPIGRPVDRCVIHHNGLTVSSTMTAGVAIDRPTFDGILVDAARRAGCTFVDRASAVIQGREVSITRDGITRSSTARWILACDGINGTSLRRHAWARWTIAPRAYLGIAATAPASVIESPAGEIHMHVGVGGYVGVVRQQNGSIHLAAALDPEACRPAATPAALAARILNSSGVNLLHWSGTGRLTRQRARLGNDNTLTVGDACGYVEPFTGQGIAWAIEAAIEAASVLCEGDDESVIPRWTDVHRRTVARHQRVCRAVRYSLRRPALVKVAMAALAAWPEAPRWITSCTRASA